MGDVKNMPPREYLFKKGQSGNPKGRPRKIRPTEAYEEALKKLVPKSMKVIEMSLDEALKTKKVTRDTINNAHKVLDRAYGTPTQRIETKTEKVDYSRMTDEEIIARTKEKLEEAQKQA